MKTELNKNQRLAACSMLHEIVQIGNSTKTPQQFLTLLREQPDFGAITLEDVKTVLDIFIWTGFVVEHEGRYELYSIYVANEQNARAGAQHQHA